MLDAVSQAQADGYIDGILVGDVEQIQQLSEQDSVNLSNLEIIDEKDHSLAAHKAAAMAGAGEADIIMKGFLPTSALLKTVLDKKHNLRGKNSLSHCAVLSIPGYDRLLNLTDGGMVVKPTLEQKLEILDNAILVGKALGLSPIRAALTGDKNEISEFIGIAQKKYDELELAGPMLLAEATQKTTGSSFPEVTGKADIYLVDSIEEGNLVGKALIGFAGAIFAGVIVGAKVPVSLVSRTDTVANKKASLAIACLLSDHYAKNQIFEADSQGGN